MGYAGMGVPNGFFSFLPILIFNRDKVSIFAVLVILFLHSSLVDIVVLSRRNYFFLLMQDGHHHLALAGVWISVDRLIIS